MKFFTNVLLLLVLLFSVISALPNSTDDSLSINDTSPTDDSLSINSTNVNVTTRADQTPMWCSVDVYLHENITLKKSESRHDRRMYITTKSYKGGALIDGLKYVHMFHLLIAFSNPCPDYRCATLGGTLTPEYRYMDTNKELFRWQKFWGNFNVRITNILGPKIVSSLDM
jgi:hypothetical protein